MTTEPSSPTRSVGQLRKRILLMLGGLFVGLLVAENSSALAVAALGGGGRTGAVERPYL